MLAAPRPNRRAFTLLEIVLVLTIIVAVGAMAAPIFMGTLRQENLRKGVELVAADWTRTRAKAMETGETQAWVCEVGASSFSSAVYETGGLSTSDASNMISANTGLDASNVSASSDNAGKTMPEGVAISEVMVSEADSVVAMAQTTMSDSSSATIFFYPDGTASSARLTVANEEQQTMSVVINGIAGTVRVVSAIGSNQ